MAELTPKEIHILSQEIEKQGLTYTLLQNELLDHLCCDIEAKMEEGLEFLKAFEEVKQRLENHRIQQIQEDTLVLVNHKYRMMKKFMYIIGTIAPSLIILGAFFKLQHWPGASVAITLGTFLLAVVYLPVFAMVSIRDTREKGKKVNKTLYITGVITGFFFLTGVLFKIMHWPGAGVALLVSVLLVVVLFIPILVRHALRDKENQLQNFSILIFILALMAVNIMVFALRVSKNVITSMALNAEGNMLTSQTVESRTSMILDRALILGPDSIPHLEQAEMLHQNSNLLDKYLHELMAEIVIATHEDNLAAVGPDHEIQLRKAGYQDSNRGVYQVLLSDEDQIPEGISLKKAVEEHRELLLSLASPELDPTIQILLQTGPMGPDQLEWLDYHFYGVPMTGALNILSGLQFNIRYLEGEVLRELLEAF